MANRHEDSAYRTNRLTLEAQPEGLPSVREILELSAVAAGRPEVLAGADSLDAAVRWAHVSDSRGVARLLNGGELLLSTGSGWPTEPGELRAFIAALVEAGLAGLVLELGTFYRYMPAVIAAAAAEHELPLIVLHREVKFVTLTEAVHNRIISAQTAALRARDEVRERFTALALRGAPADFIVARLSETLGSPVVLENLGHEVVAASLPLAHESLVLGDWQLRSRQRQRRAAHGVEPTDAAPGDTWMFVPVEARGTRWGTLVALPGPAHSAGRRSVLEQGAIALALGRLAEGDADEWARLSRERLISSLLGGRYDNLDGAAARLEAMGLPVRDSSLHGLVISGTVIDVHRADAAARALRGRAVAAPMATGTSVVLVSLPQTARFDDRAVREFTLAAASDRGATERATVDVSIGARAEDVDGLLASVQEARDLAEGASRRRTKTVRGVVVHRADDRPLVRLVAALRDDHRLLQHGEHMLAPLIEYDESRGGDLIEVLAATLAHPGNRTAAASASHLSRSVFYQRLALIADLLGTDLDDGETLTALHLALLVRHSSVR